MKKIKEYFTIAKLIAQNILRLALGTKKSRTISGLVLLALVLLISGIKYYQYNKSNPYAVWEAMVVLRSQESGGSPEEDAKTSLKRGDVIAVQAPGHAWSETEYKSYMLVKIEGRKDDVEKLLLPLVETRHASSLPAQDQNQQQTIRARKFAVDMDKVGFQGDQVISGQPVEGKVFKIDVIKEK